MTSSLQKIRGVLERIVFLNEENQYCVAEVKPSDGSPLVTIAGTLPHVQCGETLSLEGQWSRHPKFGDQFKVTQFKAELPATVHGIRKYLGSGLIQGIGPGLAEKIVDFFGDQTLRVLSSESGRLQKIPGIGKQRAKAIKDAWDKQALEREIMIFLQTYGVT
ncbi:MAG: ATP-dependent RecD-like DNA helicase, partial [Opitutales bacterium]|nr:ATP-dependent RecD-like DNA helicase [Opitutales bacterium]